MKTNYWLKALPISPQTVRPLIFLKDEEDLYTITYIKEPYKG